MASKNLKEYVVLADVVNVTNGKKANGRPAVARVLRGATINAPSDHESIEELLSMGGICLKSELPATVKSLSAAGSLRRPMVARQDVKGKRAYRITAAATAAAMAVRSADPLPETVEDIQPVVPDELDLTPAI